MHRARDQSQILVEILKKKVGKRKGTWAYKTIIKTSTGETPFALAYGSEAMILVEVGLPNHNRKGFDVEIKDKKLEENLELLEEVRADAETRIVACKRKTQQIFNKRVRLRKWVT